MPKKRDLTTTEEARLELFIKLSARPQLAADVLGIEPVIAAKVSGRVIDHAATVRFSCDALQDPGPHAD